MKTVKIDLDLSKDDAKLLYKVLKNQTEGWDKALVIAKDHVTYSRSKEEMIDKTRIFDMIKGQIIKQVGD